VAQPLTEDMQAVLWKVRKGHHGSWAGLAAAIASGTLVVLALAVPIAPLRPIASLVALGALIAMTFVLIMLQQRSTGHVLDLSANLSLQSHLARAGFAASDFFVDGAAASPTLELAIVKILALCSPDSVLELGSGQSTKVLTQYARSHPEAQVLTIEEDEAWHRRLSSTLDAPANHRYETRQLERREVTLPNKRGTVETTWYSDGESLLDGRRFQLVIVDGPTNSRRGDEFVRYSRSGFIPLLPSILAGSFAVVIDDTDNFGYVMTAQAMEQAIAATGRRVHCFHVHGVKSQTILCSPDWLFLRSV
jgi:hypothetical protein